MGLEMLGSVEGICTNGECFWMGESLGFWKGFRALGLMVSKEGF